MKFCSLLAVAGLALSCAVQMAAAQSAPGVNTGITLDHGSVWQTHKTGADTAGFVQIHNDSGGDDLLTTVSCTIGAATALVDAKGQPLASLVIPAGQTLTLAPNGPHIVITSLHYDVEYGSVIPCDFSFRDAGDLGGYLNAVPRPDHP